MRKRATKMSRQEAVDEVERLTRPVDDDLSPRQARRIQRLIERVRDCDEQQAVYDEAMAPSRVDFSAPRVTKEARQMSPAENATSDGKRVWIEGVGWCPIEALEAGLVVAGVDPGRAP